MVTDIMHVIDEDEALVGAALNGSARAWEKLVRRYEGKIYNQGLRLTGNNSDAMDLMQEVFLGVYRNLHRFRGDAKFSSWIFRIAHNKAIDINRRKRFMTTSSGRSGDQGEVTVRSEHVHRARRVSDGEVPRELVFSPLRHDGERGDVRVDLDRGDEAEVVVPRVASPGHRAVLPSVEVRRG